jgi:hypothetical protein
MYGTVSLVPTSNLPFKGLPLWVDLFFAQMLMKFRRMSLLF